MGDSITRYQAVSLIHYLHTGHWIEDDQNPNLLNERTIRFWNKYYAALMDTFNDGQNSCNNETARLQCDCFRDWGDIERWIRNVGENIYYWDPCRQNAVYSLSSLGHLPFRGRVLPEQLKNVLSPVKGLTPFRWQYPSWRDVVRHHLAKLDPPPNYVVMNAGVWPKYTIHNETILIRMRDVLDEFNMLWGFTKPPAKG